MDSITMASQRDWILMQLGPHQYCFIEPEYCSVEPESAEPIIMVCLDLVSRASIAVTTVKPAVRVQYWDERIAEIILGHGPLERLANARP
jgi:hypothetical protein